MRCLYSIIYCLHTLCQRKHLIFHVITKITEVTKKALITFQIALNDHEFMQIQSPFHDPVMKKSIHHKNRTSFGSQNWSLRAYFSPPCENKNSKQSTDAS